MFDFSGMNFTFCAFKKANFSKTNLRNTVFIDCGLKGTNWKDAEPGRTEFFGNFFSDRVTDLDGASIDFICWSSRGSEYVLFDTVSFYETQINNTNIQLDFLNCQFDDSSKMTDNVLAFSSFRSCQGINRADFERGIRVRREINWLPNSSPIEEDLIRKGVQAFVNQIDLQKKNLALKKQTDDLQAQIQALLDQIKNLQAALD